jgi:hypothetical protein
MPLRAMPATFNVLSISLWLFSLSKFTHFVSGIKWVKFSFSRRLEKALSSYMRSFFLQPLR